MNDIITINGFRYKAVESDGFCDGCIFYSLGWDRSTPSCTADDLEYIKCDADNREDGKNVIFKLMANNVTEK